MRNFNFYCFLLAAGVFFVYGQRDSSEHENASEDSNDKTKNASDSKSSEEVKQFYQQSFLITPDEKLLIGQKSFQGRKPGFLEDDDYVPRAKTPIVGKRQNLHPERYNGQLENFQQERPTYFQGALGAISAHLVHQRNQEYIPYPPNGDPYNYPAYGGHPHATEPPVIRAYERSSSSSIGALPLAEVEQQNIRRVFSTNIYPRSFPEFGNFGPGLYSGHLLNNGAPNQVRSSEQISNWNDDHTNEYAPVERLFKAQF